MTNIGGIELKTKSLGLGPGAMFFVGDATADDWRSEPLFTRSIDGHVVRRVGNRALFVSLADATLGPLDVVPFATEVAQRSLDLDSAHGEAVLDIRTAHEQHIVWRGTEDDLSLSVVVSRPYAFGASAGSPTNELEAQLGRFGGPAGAWGPCLRFYRLSQLSSDTFDSYRYSFLAVEAALSAVAPGVADEAASSATAPDVGVSREEEGSERCFAASLLDTILISRGT